MNTLDNKVLIKKVGKVILKLLLILVAFLFIGKVCETYIEYASESVRKEMYEHIPDIKIYESDKILKDELKIVSRMPDRAFSSKSFILPTKGNIVKDYYAEELLKRGWIKGKNAKGEDFYIHTDKYDEFNFYKDGYTLTWSSSIPLDKDPNTIIWGTMEERRYVIVIKKA